MKKTKYALVISMSLLLLSCGGDDTGGNLSTNTCGLLGLPTKIINGTACSDTDSPVVRITLISRSGKPFLCTGTMLTSTKVLTAAHCFFEPIRAAYIEAGRLRADATRVTVHPGVSEQPTAVFNDVAILTLKTAVNLPTVPLFTSRALEAGDKIAIYGYGQTEDESPDHFTAGILRSGQMRLDSVTPDHLIAAFDGKKGSNTCFGDSGGPAIFSSGGIVGIVGITSSGVVSDCGPGDVSLFANTQGASVLNFIRTAVPGVPEV